MKTLAFIVYTRAEIEARVEAAKAILRELDEAIAAGNRLTDFGRFRYERTKRDLKADSELLRYNNDEFIFHNGRLVEMLKFKLRKQ